MVAGTFSLTASCMVWNTASALFAVGTTQNMYFADTSVGTVSVTAYFGTSSSVSNVLSFTLLAAALFVEIDELDRLFVPEIRHMRIVEGDVPVFADAETHDVDGMFFQQFFIPLAERPDVAGAADIVHGFHPDAIEQGAFR